MSFGKNNRTPDDRIFVVVANSCEDFVNLKLKFKRLLRQRKRESSYKSINVMLVNFPPNH
jgi:hypothetical protein